jgi:tetratricopeptide (TPR) repeat protein
VQIRVGLNSGEVVVRAIGSDLHMDYTAVGQTTHLAARMEQLATAGAILLTADTLRLVEGLVQIASVGPVPVKGLAVPIEVFELTGVTAARRRFEAAAARGLTRFAGRQTELAVLAQALGRAKTGRGQIVATVGEPGVGKSRLLWEFTHSDHTHGCLVLESGSFSYGTATAYLPVIDLLKAYFRIQDRDDHRELREKVVGKLLTLDRALEPTLPAFLALLDVPVEDSAWQALDPPQRRQLTLEAIKRLLLRESQVQPLVVVFEDLHWVDSETQAVLDSLVDSLPSARLLLLVNYRPEYQHAWATKSYVAQVRVHPLPPETAEELLGGLLGEEPALAPLKQLLIERTEGNPFFLEESVRTLVETKALAGDRGAYRLAHTLDAVQVPATVQAILAARIDRLPPDQKRLLQAASVIGKDVPFVLLQTIAEQDEREVRRCLGDLQNAEFMYETSLFPELEYTFKHAVTHDVAYASLLHERRRALHARIVEAIESSYPGRLTEHIEPLGHHAFHGEAWEKAVEYLRQAGAKAFSRRAYRESGSLFEQALTALGQVSETRATLELSIDLRFDLRNAFWPLGEFGRILDHLHEAQRLAQALNDQRRLGRVFSFLTQTTWMVGDNDQAVDTGHRALAIAEAVGDLGQQVVTGFSLAQAYYSLGDYDRVVQLARRNVESLDGDLRRERFGLVGLPSVMSRTWLAWSLAERGEFPAAMAYGWDAVRLAEELDHPISLAVACWGVGGACLRKGEFDETVRALERALALCKEWHVAALFPWTAACLGYAYARLGDPARALPLLKEAVDRQASRYHQSLLRVWLGEGYLLTGQTARATELSEQALALARDRKERGFQGYALVVLAEIASHPDCPDAERAEHRYHEALALGEELGMRPLTAHCRLGLGTLYRRTDKHEQARDHLTTATSMYRDMGMTYWLEKAAAEMRELG